MEHYYKILYLIEKKQNAYYLYKDFLKKDSEPSEILEKLIVIDEKIQLLEELKNEMIKK